MLIIINDNSISLARYFRLNIYVLRLVGMYRFTHFQRDKNHEGKCYLETSDVSVPEPVYNSNLVVFPTLSFFFNIPVSE